MVAQIRLQLSDWLRETSLRDGAPLKSADGTRVPPTAEDPATVRPSVAALQASSAGTAGDREGSGSSAGADGALDVSSRLHFR